MYTMAYAEKQCFLHCSSRRLHSTAYDGGEFCIKKEQAELLLSLTTLPALHVLLVSEAWRTAGMHDT